MRNTRALALLGSSKYPLLVIDMYGEHAQVYLSHVSTKSNDGTSALFSRNIAAMPAPNGASRTNNSWISSNFDVNLVHIPEHAPTLLRRLRLPEDEPGKLKQQPQSMSKC